MGTRGPVPKRSDQRRRTNAPPVPIKKSPAGKPAPPKSTVEPTQPRTTRTRKPRLATRTVETTPARKPRTRKPAPPKSSIPAADTKWHPVALAWYRSLARSGQSAFYEPSDWALAFLIAESMSRDLQPQVVGVIQEGKDAGEVVKDTIPLKGASLSAYLRAMSVLLVTEGDRRRLSVELQKAAPADPDAERALATVTDLRSRLGG